jgi:integrase/recombinase XerD
MEEYGELAGLPKELRHPHCLKNSIATHMLEAGVDLQMVQDALGHAEIDSTVIYEGVANVTRDRVQGDLYFKMPRF